ncbi:hypothetical protein BGZ57DRAFT_898653 [Hyaloscypha finlandica]|nr:hypothetical protein BGZ57DRAFT_898653 [Hyaloscypha finlandica]
MPIPSCPGSMACSTSSTRTSDIADSLSYSQHCQVFGVLCGAAAPSDRARLLLESFAEPTFSKCSYVMKFYAL